MWSSVLFAIVLWLVLAPFSGQAVHAQELCQSVLLPLSPENPVAAHVCTIEIVELGDSVVFRPNSAAVLPNTRVVFRNSNDTQHTVQSSQPGCLFNVGTLLKGELSILPVEIHGAPGKVCNYGEDPRFPNLIGSIIVSGLPLAGVGSGYA